MSISTFAELKVAVANWINRSDLTDRIPEFVAIAESTIANDSDSGGELPGVRCRAQEKRVTTSVSTRYVDAPADLLEILNIQLNSDRHHRLTYRTPEQVDAEYDSSSSGEPRVWTYIGDELQFAPTPADTYTVEIAYRARFAALSADADTNWLLTNHPQIYLYATLLAATPFLQDNEQAEVWGRLYRSAVIGLNDAESKARLYAGTLVMRPDIVPE